MRLLYFLAMYGKEHLGQEIHRELIEFMQARGHSVRVFALAGREQAVASVQPSTEEGIPVYRHVVNDGVLDRGLNRVSKPLFVYDRFLAGLRHYGNHAKQHSDFDLVHVESAYPLGAIAALTRSGAKKPFVVHIGGGDLIANVHAQYGYGRYARVRSLLRFTFRRASLVRAVSPHAAELALELDCPPEKIITLPRNISASSFPPAGQTPNEWRARARERIATRWKLGEAPLIVSIGRLLPIKGFNYLIQALPQIQAAVGAVHVLLVGPERGDYGDHLRALAQALGVSDLITFVGSVPKDEAGDYLAAADVVAVPSVEEGGNKMVIEAAAVGTPFVATETAGTPEYTRGWDCGLIVPAQDEQALAAGLIKLLKAPPLREQMGQNGQVLAKNFSTERIGERLLQAYQFILAGKPVPEELRLLPAGLKPSVTMT